MMCVFVAFIHRLKARKFQLVPTDYGLSTKSQHVSCKVDDKSSRSLSCNDSNHEQFTKCLMPRKSSKMAPVEPFLDERFDADVENVRAELEGSDLKFKHAVLIEVWSQEVASCNAPAWPSLTRSMVSHTMDSVSEATSKRNDVSANASTMNSDTALAINQTPTIATTGITTTATER